MMRDTYAHDPAMTPQEAALLPAMAASPGRLIMPVDESHFIPVAAAEESPALRQGSTAGRAILHADGVNLPGISRMGCARGRRRKVHVEMDCDRICWDE